MAETSTVTTSAAFTVETFDSTKTRWSRWVKRLEVAFTVFKVPENLKLHYLLHFMGAEAYDILSDKLAPETPETKTYKYVVDTMDQFYDPAPLEIAETFRFQSRKQYEGEGVQEFLHALQKLALHCNFGAFLKTALRNQFVYGLHSKRIQSRLLETKDLTLDKAVEIAVGIEMSEKDTNQLNRRSATTVDSINYRSKKPNPTAVSNAKSQSHSNSHVSKFTKPNYVKKCYRCGSTEHLANKCDKVNSICNFCKLKGHLQRVCTKAKKALHTHEVEEVEGTVEELLEIVSEEDFAPLRAKYYTSIQVSNKHVRFEIDSGAPVSLININEYKASFTDCPLHSTKLKLISYCKTMLKVAGYIHVNVQYREVNTELNLYVVQGDRNPLLGREWIRKLNLNLQDCDSTDTISEVNTLKANSIEVAKLLNKYETIFQPGIGVIRDAQASIYLKENTIPVFLKARPVPFALQPAIETEISSLVEQGILQKVDTSDWATPVVPVVKADGSIRLCGDYKVTLNPNILVDDHPLPTVDELFAQMAGGSKFSKIDISKAYLHLEVKPEMRHLLTLNTHKGLYMPTRLMFGVSSAPAIWQRLIEQILQGIPGVSVFLDDIKITGPDTETHLHRLNLVLGKLHYHNLKVNFEKSVFLVDEIEYCGYRINKYGIQKVKSKIDAIQNVQVPRDKSQVRAFVGLINYYRRFIKDASTILQPLNNLLKDTVPFEWSKACQKAFEEAKEVIQSEQVLCHFDPTLPLVLATDASPFGVGAVLSHILPDGSERPIQFASQTLTKTQQKYSQIDKEAYSLIYGIKKFYQYVCGRRFTLVTDHKPLLQIFSPSRSLPVLSATRMQHYAIFLQSFQYDIRYKNTNLHSNADAMSRLPLTSEDLSIFDVPDVFELRQIETLPVTVEMLAKATEQDNSLSKLLSGLRTGETISKEFCFNIKQEEFSLQSGCIMRGQRVVVPISLRKEVLSELHTAHFGVVKMKALARSYCWWPGIDNDIEKLTKNCYGCNKFKNNVERAETHVWEKSKMPFERVHIDYAGPFNGGYYFILVDSFTKWPEIYYTRTITAEATIEICRKIFSTFGIPKVLVSDNGSNFVSYKFRTFLKENGILHKLTAPYHPATNGQAERYVQILKKSLRAMRCDQYSRNLELCKLLLQYRKIPHETTGKSPAELMFNRPIRTRLDLLMPELNKTKNDSNPNQNKKFRSLSIGVRVSVRDYFDEKWKFGHVLARTGKLHYIIKLDDGRKWRRHIDQIREIGCDTPLDKYLPHEKFSRSILPDINHSRNLPILPNLPNVSVTDRKSLGVQANVNLPDAHPNLSFNKEDTGVSAEPAAHVPDVSTNSPELRRSSRVRKPPERLDL